jgi:hypothetical protein
MLNYVKAVCEQKTKTVYHFWKVLEPTLLLKPLLHAWLPHVPAAVPFAVLLPDSTAETLP